MPSLLPIGGTIRLNASPGGAATVVPLAEGGFAAVYRITAGLDAFTLYDDNFQPISGEELVTADDILAPQAGSLSSGQFVVAWLAQDQTIQASIYNPDGTLAIGPVVLANPTDPAVGLSAPRVVGNAFGGFTAIWQDNATINGVAGAVFIQSYDSEGNLVGDPISVVPPTANPSDTVQLADFRIAILGDGTTVVAAQVLINGIESIMYSVNGDPLVSLAGGDPDYLYTNPQVTPLAAGGFVITYDFVNPLLVGVAGPDANWTTGGSVFTSHGTRHDFAIGSTVTTTANGTFAVDPSVITPLADGGFVVTFEPLTSPLGDGYLVDAQQFDGFGNAVGPVVLVAPQGFLPSVATSANGVVLDTFQFGSGIFLQAFGSAPTPFGPEPDGTSFGLNSVVSANSPGVAPLSTGGFVVVYEDQNGNSWAQIYDVNRQPAGSAFQIASPGTQPVVATQTNGTFLVAWSNGHQIMGALYDNQGDQLSGPFSMSGDPATLRVLDPAINSLRNGGFSMAYETDLQDGSGSHLVTIQQFDPNGNAVGPALSQNYAPTNPLAPPKIAKLEAQLYGSITVMGVGDAIVAAIVSDPPSGGGSAGVAAAMGSGQLGFGQSITVTSHASAPPTVSTVQVSGGSDGATRAGVQIATLNDGNVVVVWNEAASGAEVWQIVGQVLTPAGGFVGGEFVVGTSLPSNSPASQLALSALPDGGFLITYDSGNASLASQRFDAGGNEIGPPVLMSGPGQADVVTALLSNGTLVLFSDNAPAGGGTVVGRTFSVPSIPMNWTGGTSTNLGTGANWDIQAGPDTGHVMQFGLTNGGTLTGPATAASATFSGHGPWVLSGGIVNLTQDLTNQSTLQVAGGSVTAGGGAAIGATGGASLTVSGAAQASFQSTAIGTNAGQTGTLTVSGSGTDWMDTGTAGAGGLQAGASSGAQPGHGVISVTQGALLTGSDTDILGVTAGSEGDLSITVGGQVSDAGLVVGAAGTGVVSVNGGTLGSTGSVVLGRDGGGQGTLSVTGTTSSVTASGAMIVGDVGFGQLSVSQGGSVSAASLDEAAAVGGSGIISVTGSKSAITVSGLATIGDHGPATLSILNGGTFQAQNLNLGVGSSTGAITIGGTATDFNITNDMTVGHNGVFSIGAGVTVFIAGNFDEIGAVNLGDGSLIDPASVTNSSPHGGGGGSGVTGTTSITNSSTYSAGGPNNGSFILSTPLLNGAGVLEIDPAQNPGVPGDLVLNAGSVTSTQSVVFSGASGILTLGTDGAAMAITGFQATINNFVAGDTIVVDTTAAAGFVLNGSVISVVNTVGGATEGTLAFANATFAGIAAGTPGALVDQVACFAAGTGIATTRGLVPVECIHPGDRVCTVLGGDTSEVIWVGRRKVDCARHANPSLVWPVRVSAHAFGRGMPATDLLLSPDHAVYVDRVLIPIRLLVNGRTVRQELVDRISYYHIELEQHDVLLANGMPAESYLDTGDRARFSNGGGVIALHPDFSAHTWEMRGCAPLVQTGQVLAAVRKRLANEVARRTRRQSRDLMPGNMPGTTGPR